jgi:hypothetical protein
VLLFNQHAEDAGLHGSELHGVWKEKGCERPAIPPCLSLSLG